MKRTLLLLATLAFLGAAPHQIQTDSSSWQLKDSHQGFTVAADPYVDAARSKAKFGKVDPYNAGLLAVNVLFKNDTTDPVHVDLTTIRLEGDSSDGHFRLHALTLNQAAAQIAHPRRGPSLPVPRRLPIPLGGGGDRKANDVANKLQPLSLQSDVVPPKGSIQGIVFFDVSGHFDLASRADLYVPDVKSVASENAMIYFDVPLASHH